jgi:hypothetical protein
MLIFSFPVSIRPIITDFSKYNDNSFNFDKDNNDDNDNIFINNNDDEFSVNENNTRI